jgi:hypothetical protein
MRRADAQAEIHRIARESQDNVRLTRHAEVRNPGVGKLPLMKPEIVAVLREGIVTEGPFPDIRIADAWKFTMRRVYGLQKFEVAGVLLPEANILVITGYKDIPFHRR